MSRPDLRRSALTSLHVRPLVVLVPVGEADGHRPIAWAVIHPSRDVI